MKEDYPKALKKLTLFFLSNPVPFDGQSHQKQKGPLVASRSSGHKTSLEKFLCWLYYLTKFDDIMKSSFRVISKITFANLCTSIHDIINYSTSNCPCESGKYEKGKKSQKFEYLENEKSFLDETKHIFQFLKGCDLVKK